MDFLSEIENEKVKFMEMGVTNQCVCNGMKMFEFFVSVCLYASHLHT